ncbi:MAG: hypothetical protein H6621_11585 [Halobacteriovoraceae bacterium]|nr:hypothetical protein [Halobacteriovoraceae bacterium]MCB9095701.1 hypothetical protein [Halobacteriovoraceae bacterium]
MKKLVFAILFLFTTSLWIGHHGTNNTPELGSEDSEQLKNGKKLSGNKSSKDLDSKTAKLGKKSRKQRKDPNAGFIAGAHDFTEMNIELAGEVIDQNTDFQQELADVPSDL